MPIVYEKLLNYPIPEVRQALRWQDTALYNFSVGLGQDPMDERQLDFRLRAAAEGDAVDAGGARRARLLVAQRRYRHRLEADPARRAGRGAAPARCPWRARSSAAPASPAWSTAARARAR